mmetsp:Transcript_39398/g.34865  ORF Transcript_39398/g.34865 Transcript_39398/m.34865 type:complete len:121 (-) Transcript_39398:58-420(-)
MAKKKEAIPDLNLDFSKFNSSLNSKLLLPYQFGNWEVNNQPKWKTFNDVNLLMLQHTWTSYKTKPLAQKAWKAIKLVLLAAGIIIGAIAISPAGHGWGIYASFGCTTASGLCQAIDIINE